MPDPVYAHNHTVDPATGFIESNAYPYAFDAEKKKAFIEAYKAEGLGIYGTCELFGLSRNTLIKHVNLDPEFKQQFEEAELEYASRLEAASRRNSMKENSVIERIFQLKALSRRGLTISKYDEENNSHNGVVVNLTIDTAALDSSRKREAVIEGQLVQPQQMDGPKDAL